MNSYGDPPSYGRAQMSGNGRDPYDGQDLYGAYADEYAAHSYGADPYPADSYRADSRRVPHQPDSPARPVARAAVRVPAAPAPDAPAAPRYDWSRSGGGRTAAPVSPSPAGPARGRASVPPPGSGGPGGPSGPGDGRPPARRKKKRHWLRNSLLSLLAITVMMAGGGMVALSWYVDSVPAPQDMDLPQASTIVYADGSEEMAVLQDKNREIIDTTVPELENARVAVVAAEDKDFYDHQGVDFAGIVRAAWNNFTGGERQGASTIDQQYTRAAEQLYEDSYLRKLKEAAKAYKLNQQESKETILGYYLNTIYFGRGAYGIQAAAEAYFGKDAAELTLAQAAVLAGVIRLPDDGSGMSPYDPLRNPEDTAAAEKRFRYVLGQLVSMGHLTPEESAAMELPEVIDPVEAQDWHIGPQGPIVTQVRQELEAMGITDLSTGGYRITTTIDPELQDAALDAARRESGGVLWEGGDGFRTPEENVGAALVSIDPTSGAVRAYYGGEDGFFDTAGENFDEESGQWYGGRPPGSTFKIYTLIAALRKNVSVESRWKAGEFTPDTYDRGVVHNAGRSPEGYGCPDPDWCTLRWATEQSFNVPFYYFAYNQGLEGPISVVDAAKDAGITLMTGQVDGETKVVDLREIEDASALQPNPFFYEVAYGQYPVTVLGHASGVATLANKGVHHKPYFVEKVEQRNDQGEWEEVRTAQIAGETRVAEQIAVAITDVLTKVPGITGVPLANGRPSAAKTGTWEYDPKGPEDQKRGNADAWMVGYTPQLATAVWVGDPEKSVPVKYTDGGDIPSSGLPSHVWKQFMDAAHAAKDYPHETFPPARPIGVEQHELANGVEPEPEDDDDDCRFGIFCRGDDDDDDDNGNGNGRGNDDDGDDSDGEGGGGGLLPGWPELPDPSPSPDPIVIGRDD